jgi:transposase
VLDNEHEHASRWATIESISGKIGCVPQTLLEWVKKSEINTGKRAGVPTEIAERMKALEREVRELRQANEILRKASAYFSQGSSTARFGSDRIHGDPCGELRDRVDVQGSADRPLHLARARSP